MIFITMEVSDLRSIISHKSEVSLLNFLLVKKSELSYLKNNLANISLDYQKTTLYTTIRLPLAVSSFEQALKGSSNLICLSPTGVSVNHFAWVCWCVWTARNSLVFENRDLSPSDIIVKAIGQAREWQDAQPQKTQLLAPHDTVEPITRT